MGVKVGTAAWLLLNIGSSWKKKIQLSNYKKETVICFPKSAQKSQYCCLRYYISSSLSAQLGQLIFLFLMFYLWHPCAQLDMVHLGSRHSMTAFPTSFVSDMISIYFNIDSLTRLPVLYHRDFWWCKYWALPPWQCLCCTKLQLDIWDESSQFSVIGWWCETGLCSRLFSIDSAPTFSLVMSGSNSASAPRWLNTYPSVNLTCWY